MHSHHNIGQFQGSEYQDYEYSEPDANYTHHDEEFYNDTEHKYSNADEAYHHDIPYETANDNLSGDKEEDAKRRKTYHMRSRKSMKGRIRGHGRVKKRHRSYFGA